MNELVKYEAAKHALAEAKSIDEVKQIHDVAAAMKAYAIQAKDQQLMVDASVIRIRAERRLGEMIVAQKTTVGLNPGTRPSRKHGGTMEEPPSDMPTLAEAGIDKKLSSRSQKTASIPAAQFDQIILEHEDAQRAVAITTMAKLAKQGEEALAQKKHAPEPQKVYTLEEVKKMKVGNGRNRAKRATLELDEISDTDCELQEALQTVIGYCKRRQKQTRKARR